MKKLLALLIFAMSANIYAQDLSGTWQCRVMDSHDGAIPDEKIILTKSSEHSVEASGYTAYHLKLVVKGGDEYDGAAVSTGNSMALWFEGHKDQSDRGVGLVNFEHHLNTDGTYTDQLSKFYFEPKYFGKGSHGFASCVRG